MRHLEGKPSMKNTKSRLSLLFLIAGIGFVLLFILDAAGIMPLAPGGLPVAFGSGALCFVASAWFKQGNHQ